MGVHQIIYTSCMRGINGVNDGQQIFSYDAKFDDFNNNDIKRLFSYQPPALESGVIMTEEIAATLPHAFTYRKLENGKCTLTLSTYLGRDYMGSAGRFGNHLSHVIVSNEQDFRNYPCEFYNSILLKNHMEYEEVNNPNQPDYLPTPILEKGYSVGVESVFEFLEIGDRLEIYKNMLYAMLAFEREQKRVVICDDPENIVMWIAALEYAIPLKNALDINFTTYEFDPSLSASQICGVVKNGTRYTSESKKNHFVFDIYQNDYAEFEKDTYFYDFIDTAFSLSYDSIQDFHAFLSEGYSYEKIDEELYSAYALYSLLSDGIVGMIESRLEEALSFVQKYATIEKKLEITKKLLSQCGELLIVDKWVFLDIVKYIFFLESSVNSSELLVLKNAIIDRILNEFLNDAMNEDTFIEFYNEINGISIQYEFNLATELMLDNNRIKLFAVMENNTYTWKYIFIVRTVSNYIKENNIPVDELMLDKPLGHTYYEIIMAVYSKNVQNGVFLMSYILDEFAFDCLYLVNMALNIEGMLLDLPNGEKEVETLWKYFGQKMIANQSNNFEVAYDVLNCYQRHEQIFMMFSLEMQEASNTANSKDIFNKHFNDYVSQNKIYSTMYEQNVLSLYFNRLREFDNKETRVAKVELLELLINAEIDADFSDELIREMLKNISLKNPSKQDANFIQNVFHYIYNFKRKPITGKLLLLLIGMVIEGIESRKQITEKIEQLEILTQTGRADLSKLSEKALNDYFTWILPIVCKICQSSLELTKFYDFFEMSINVKKQFFSECTKIYLKQCKDEKKYAIFAGYFEFVCENSNIQIREEIGKSLCILNKNKMEELDEIICEIYHSNRKFIEYWENIKDGAETSNPLLNNISNMFKKRKREDIR